MACLNAHYHSFFTLTVMYLQQNHQLQRQSFEDQNSWREWVKQELDEFFTAHIPCWDLNVLWRTVSNKVWKEKCSLLWEMCMCCNCNCMFIYIAPFQQNSSEVLSAWLRRDPVEWNGLQPLALCCFVKMYIILSKELPVVFFVPSCK